MQCQPKRQMSQRLTAKLQKMIEKEKIKRIEITSSIRRTLLDEFRGLSRQTIWLACTKLYNSTLCNAIRKRAIELGAKIVYNN